jgi:hypothetical protein
LIISTVTKGKETRWIIQMLRFLLKKNRIVWIFSIHNCGSLIIGTKMFFPNSPASVSLVFLFIVFFPFYILCGTSYVFTLFSPVSTPGIFKRKNNSYYFDYRRTSYLLNGIYLKSGMLIETRYFWKGIIIICKRCS